jgi:hypothetical protein
MGSGFKEAARGVTAIGAVGAFLILGVLLPYVTLRTTLEDAYEAGPFLPPALFGWTWLALFTATLLIGIRGRHVPISRGLLVGAIAAVSLLVAFAFLFYIVNRP